MNKNDFNTPLQLNDIKITDTFWKSKMELVRTNVIPFQWNALNDQIEDAAPSFCMHNFKAAAKMNQEKRLQGSDFPEPDVF